MSEMNKLEKVRIDLQQIRKDLAAENVRSDARPAKYGVTQAEIAAMFKNKSEQKQGEP
ncbi:MAG: hypothetical protein LBP68_03650 [Acidobacteriota bacterium]|jgi:hypothetical protein|nr:hypothetical protein [Acidobacteriota bacterium]